MVTARCSPSAASPRLEPFLGNRYPATDIPQIARRLYERNRVRVLADVQERQSPLVPHLSPLTGQDLDMSLCFLRSMSPIHIQYLKNMGVAATLVASLVVGGRLWGLVACHHYCPRFVHYETRAACELLAETVATRIAALESFVQAQAELSVRRLEQRMVEAISRDGDWRTALFDASQPLLQPLGATGAALLFEGQMLTAGEVPGTAGAARDRRLARPAAANAGCRHGLPRPSTSRLRALTAGGERAAGDAGVEHRPATICFGFAPSGYVRSPGAATRRSRSWLATTRASCRRAGRSRNGTSWSKGPPSAGDPATLPPPG